MSQFMVFKSNNFKNRYKYPANSHPSTSGPNPSNPVLEFIKKAKNNSESPVKFIDNVYQSLCNSLCLIIVSAILLFLPISMLIVGAIYKNDCPIDPRIPAWLIVSGVVGIIYGVSRIVVSAYVLKKNTNKQKEPSPFTWLFVLLGLFSAIWFTMGNIWVFQIFDRVQYTSSAKVAYCHAICYLFSFWSIVICWILVGLLLLFVLGIVLFFAFTFLMYICNK